MREGEENKGKGIWNVPTMSKDPYAYKVISNQMKGTKLSWRGMPKSADTGDCLVSDQERSGSATVMLQQGDIMIPI